MHGLWDSIAIALLIVQSLGASPIYAQAGDPYNLDWNTIDGGGATFVQGGDYALGGTIGQTDANSSSGGSYTLHGGFWGGLIVEPVPTQTPTLTPLTPVPTPTGTPTRTRTATRTPTPTVTGSPPPVACYGDCNDDLMVSVDELVRGVSIALEILPPSNCPGFGVTDAADLAIYDLVAAVYASLNGCNVPPVD